MRRAITVTILALFLGTALLFCLYAPAARMDGMSQGAMTFDCAMHCLIAEHAGDLDKAVPLAITIAFSSAITLFAFFVLATSGTSAEAAAISHANLKQRLRGIVMRN